MWNSTLITARLGGRSAAVEPHRRLDRRPHRWVRGGLAAALVVPLLVLAPLVFERPAGAEGFNFLCEAPGGPPGESEFEQMANGLAVKIISDQAIWVFHGTVPAGIPVTVPGAVTDPVTGETSFDMPIAPHPGNSQRMDFIPSSVPGAAGDEIRFGFSFRNKAGQRADDLSMLELLTENYGLPLEPGNDINVAGVDINFETNAIMGNLQGFRGSFSAFYTYRLRGNENNLAVGTFKINSTAPGARIPEEGTLSLSIRKPPDATSSYVIFGQRTIHHEFNGTANQPAVGYGIDLARAELVPGDILFDPFVSMNLAWSAAPRSLAIGIGSLCPDKGHLAWNHDGLPNPAAASVGVDVKYGIEEGLPILVDPGTGPAPINADIMDVQGSINGLPSQMDVILLRDAMSFTRSPDVAPDLDLTRLAMADDDPADPDDLPLFATAKVTDIPRHLLLTTEDAADGSFARGELTSWNLDCPGEPDPTAPPAPDELRRLDLPETLPGFPVGCVRHSLTPVPNAEALVQNWLPEDLNGQAAAAGLAPPPLTATQFGYFATRDVHPLSTEALRAFGGRINGVQRVTVDLTAAADDEDQARVYVERAPVAGADDSFRVVADIDGLTSGDELANTGARIQTSALVPDLPDRIRLDYRRAPDTPLELTWRADAPIAVIDATFEVQGAGPEALIARGAFETGAAGSGLPPTARLRIDDELDGSGGAVHWSAAPPVTDGFPTPISPPFDPTTLTRVHAGAQLSSHDDRAAGLATRLHADIKVPQPVDIEWVTGADGALESVDGRFCDPDVPEACAGTRLDATVVKNLEGPVTGTDLLLAPAIPVPGPDIAGAVQPFTDYRPSTDGIRAVNLAPDVWGADALVRGLERIAYDSDPLDVAVELADPAPKPFVVNLLDAAPAEDASGAARTQILFADAVIDRLPSDMRLRLQGADAAPTEPLLWVNTEDVAIDDIATVDWSTDPAGTRPTIQGVVRFGDAELLRTERPASGRPQPRPAGAAGVDVWADFSLDQELLAVDAAALLEIPRHVAVWRPDLTRCDPDAPDASTCQDRPLYEMDDISDVKVELRTTSEAIGQLHFEGDLRGEGLDWTVRGRVGQVPGSLTGTLRITDNLRLPWLQVDAELDGSAALESVLIDLKDNNSPVEYRSAPDGEGEAQCEGAGDVCTSNYAVALTGVPADLEVHARVQGATEDRLIPGPEEPADSPEPQTDVGGIAFVHAEIDLHGVATQLRIDGHEGDDGQFVGTMEAFGAAGDRAGVSGFVNARVDHVSIKHHPPGEAGEDPFTAYFVDSGGITGIGASLITDHGATVGHVIQALFWGVAVLDFVVGIVLAILYDGTAEIDFELDMDLPLSVGFDQVDTLRFGMSGPVLSVDERHNGGGVPAEIGTLQLGMAHEAEPDLQINGAFFHHREVDFTFDSLVESFDIDNTLDNSLDHVGLFRHQSCLTHDEDDVCYFGDHAGIDAVQLDQVLAETPREGFDSADILVDFLFNAGNRSEMDDENFGAVEPGVRFYKGFAEGSDPVTADAFLRPLLGSSFTPDEDVFTTRSFCCNTTRFHVLTPGQPPTTTDVGFGPVCGIASADEIVGGPRAVGPDGTTYIVRMVRATSGPEEAPRTFCDASRLVLEAHYPGNPAAPEGLGAERWTIALPTPAGLESGGACREDDARCEFATFVTPRADGSVQVETFTTVFAGGVEGDDLDTSVFLPFHPSDTEAKVRALFACCPNPEVNDVDGEVLAGVKAWVDASGHPGFHLPQDAQIPAFGVVDVTASVTDENRASLDPCAVAPAFACGPLPEGHTAQWLFGDGTMSAKLGGQLPAVQHRYPHSPAPDQFLGLLVHYDENGVLVDKAYFRLAI